VSAARVALDLPDREVGGCLYPHSGAGNAPAFVLHDEIPGGGGHAQRIGRHLDQVWEAALRLLEACTCGSDTACYGCIKSYTNQFCHDRLRRGPAARFFAEVYRSTLIPHDPAGQPLRFCDAGRWLANRMLEATEVLAVLPRVVRPDASQGRSGIDWVKDVLSPAAVAGAAIRLGIPAGPAATETLDALEPLRSSVSVTVKTLAGPESPPSWPIVVVRHAPLLPVAVCWTDESAWHRGGLTPETGLDGLVVQEDPELVLDAREQLAQILGG
jgi:hypothetical protein